MMEMEHEAGQSAPVKKTLGFYPGRKKKKLQNREKLLIGQALR